MQVGQQPWFLMAVSEKVLLLGAATDWQHIGNMLSHCAHLVQGCMHETCHLCSFRVESRQTV